MMVNMAPLPRDVLRDVFGYQSFLPLQEEIIRRSLAGEDALVLMPTGGGKSLCFQVPALCREGLTLVISPLVALMKDQVGALKANGVAADFLNDDDKYTRYGQRLVSMLKSINAADDLALMTMEADRVDRGFTYGL
jgi:superfamily II DNA helicase RecQ